MTTQVTHAAPAAPAPDTRSATERRVSDLLMRLHRAEARDVVLTPLAELRPAADGTGDSFVFATVFLDAGDGLGRAPVALHELRLAAACLSDDAPFAVAPGLAARLRTAADQAARAALKLQRSA